MAGDTILIKDISINGTNLTKTDLSETLTDNTINALGIDASSRTIWINGQPYGNAYVNINEDNTVEASIGAEIFNDFEHNIASGDYSHAEGKGTITNNEAEHASGKYNQSHKDTTIFSVGIGESKDERKNAIEVTQDGNIYVNGIGGYDGKNPSDFNDLATYLPNMVYITYKDLKTLRDNGKLVPGQQYRITDYTCTTITPGTKSAGNVFDIIVTANDSWELNEEARATQNETDSKFDEHELDAWKIWYCLDNDTTRFAWADSTNGKGVIYRMIDEFGNDCPYDFKNIQFYRELDENTGLYSVISDDNIGIPCYTFSSETLDSTNKFTDMSLSASNKVYSNVIKKHVLNRQQNLNNNCFFGSLCYANTLENGCIDNTFGSNCHFNTLGSNCLDNTFGGSCSDNIFGNSCSSNTFGGSCFSNTFGNSCSSNTFGNSYAYNSFENNCDYNSFRVSADTSSTLKEYVYYNHFDDGCSYNVIWNSDTTNSRVLLKNINVNRGVVGTSSSYNMIYVYGLNSEQEINVNQVDGIVSIGNILRIKYESLKALRDNDQLIPGRQYRIIDYICTTTRRGTTSAGNRFDIIVTADSPGKLNEEARASLPTGGTDPYFAYSDLNAWKIWYSLDNNTTRFNWADTTNGKGVIYRMIDEFDNDCPYDFKNIQFYRELDANTGLYSIISDDNIGGVPCYTFSSAAPDSTSNFTDTSLEASNTVYSNVIKKYINFNKQTLNNICFFGNDCHNNTFGSNCCDSTFGSNCSYNTLGNKCDYNTLGNYCSHNTFWNDCDHISFGNSCYYNSFGNGCEYIKFASDSSASATKYNYYQYNHFGDGCQYIVFNGGEGPSSAQVQNYNFTQGLQGTLNDYLYIAAERNRLYETTVAKNASGELKTYCATS